MKRIQIPTGKCACCGSDYEKAAMAKHLISCQQKDNSVKKPETQKAGTFHIMVEGDGLPQYWLYLAAKTNAKLKQLDDFLRNIWLECCGHMSAFEIAGTRYYVTSDTELGGENMNIGLGKVLCVGTKFSHKYDFGSTTRLVLKVLSKQEDENTGQSIKLLARNNPPEIVCQLCGQPATELCTECVWSARKGIFCNKCAKSHEFHRDMFLPVVNSPRVGVCGYTG
ncbi:MAG: hypothetical protein CVV39_03710 [Planctomycetes bacterium HGW-Planctomycetes-1]|nr:MAG: hypothetical protein CVV39_03710 [Planctomycetes bacterium HGW-Planctomycetes-1]